MKVFSQYRHCNLKRFVVGQQGMGSNCHNLLCQLGFQKIQKLVDIDKIIGETNVEVMFREHVLEEKGSIEKTICQT